MSTETLVSLPLWLVAFLLSTTCHEAAHALVAKIYGDLTAYHDGHVTLDPIPHIKRSPFGMIIVPIISFLLNGWMIGWASVPVDGFWSARNPKKSALVSAAGPAANFIIVLIVGAVIMVGVSTGKFAAPTRLKFDNIVVLADQSKTMVTTMISILFSLNLLLATFNLIPVPPLDGHQVITLFMPENLGRKWRELFSEPGYAMIGLVIAWVGFGKVFAPIFFVSVNLLFPDANYVSR